MIQEMVFRVVVPTKNLTEFFETLDKFDGVQVEQLAESPPTGKPKKSRRMKNLTEPMYDLLRSGGENPGYSETVMNRVENSKDWADYKAMTASGGSKPKPEPEAEKTDYDPNDLGLGVCDPDDDSPIGRLTPENDIS